MSRKSWFALAVVGLTAISAIAVMKIGTAPGEAPASTSSTPTNSPPAPKTAEGVAKPLIEIVAELGMLRTAVVKAEAAEKQSSEQYGVIYDRYDAHHVDENKAYGRVAVETARAFQSTDPVATAFAPVYAAKAQLDTVRREQEALYKDLDKGAAVWQEAKEATGNAMRAFSRCEERLETAARRLLLEDVRSSETELYSDALLLVVKELAKSAGNPEAIADALKDYEAAHASFLGCVKKARETAVEDAKFDEVRRRGWRLEDKMTKLLKQPFSKDLEPELEEARKEGRDLASFADQIKAVGNAESSAHLDAKEAQETRKLSFYKFVQALR